ncbi:ORF76 [White spot syndrome virus]|uniref:ORF76 n=1 Tax=White spot syndrome virus TaxID=342409 RepID=A0A2D3I6Z4_9VIRU|nr:ORF76 [White spot syndrome virus]
MPTMGFAILKPLYVNLSQISYTDTREEVPPCCTNTCSIFLRVRVQFLGENPHPTKKSVVIII